MGPLTRCLWPVLGSVLVACGPAADDSGASETATPAPWQLVVHPLAGEVRELWASPGGAVLRTVDDRRWVVATSDAGLSIAADPGAPDAFDPAALTALLPDSRPALGTGRIAVAWLSDPTDRYPHGALGDEEEAAALRVRTDTGDARVLELPVDAVFEDLQPRLADLDGDGGDEIVLVRSTTSDGAGLVAAALEGDTLRLTIFGAQDRPSRWLDPAGIADFDGDGALEVAFVRRPHLDGTLTLVRREGATFAVLDTWPGVSNHLWGRTDLRRAGVLHDGPAGLPLLAVPSPDHAALHLFTAPGGRWIEHAVLPLPGRVASDFVVLDPTTLVFGVEDGQLVQLVVDPS